MVSRDARCYALPTILSSRRAFWPCDAVAGAVLRRTRRLGYRIFQPMWCLIFKKGLARRGPVNFLKIFLPCPLIAVFPGRAVWVGAVIIWQKDWILWCRFSPYLCCFGHFGFWYVVRTVITLWQYRGVRWQPLGTVTGTVTVYARAATLGVDLGCLRKQCKRGCDGTCENKPCRGSSNACTRIGHVFHALAP